MVDKSTRYTVTENQLFYPSGYSLVDDLAVVDDSTQQTA